MSKILKKITKKYKWLRFLNRKVTKLSVLGASLVGLCISSGASFAKYRDENYGNGNAGAAKFGAKVSSTAKLIILPKTINSSQYGYYAYVAEFNIDFTNCEVKCNYTLSLKLNGEFVTDYDSSTTTISKTRFSTPNYSSNQSGFYTTTGDYDTATIVTDNVPSLLTGGQVTSFQKNNMYYAFKNNTTDNYTWSTTTNSNTRIINIVSSPLSVNIGEIHYYKVIYFTEINSYTAENSNILINLNMEQED